MENPITWLKQRELSNDVISHPMAGDQYVECVSDAMRAYAEHVVSITRQKEAQDTQSRSLSAAPSNHSSSEMVEVGKVVDMLKKHNQFQHLSELGWAELITQIRNI